MLYRPEWDRSFERWLDMYFARLEAVSGWEVKPLLLPEFGEHDEAEEDNRAYLDELYGSFVSGVDAVEAADDEIREWPPHQRLNVGLQSAEDFRKKWRG